MVPLPPGQDPMLSHFLPFSQGSPAGTRVTRQRVQSLLEAGFGLLSGSSTLDPLCCCCCWFLHLIHPSHPARGGPGPAARHKWPLCPPWEPELGWRSVVAAIVQPGPPPTVPLRARHLLFPLNLGRSRPAGTQRGRADWPEVAKAKGGRDRPAQRPGTWSRGQTPAIAADLGVPFHPRGSRETAKPHKGRSAPRQRPASAQATSALP